MHTALIVEDDETTRYALSEFIEREGFATLTAANFEEARGELARVRPDVVLLDMYLPVGSGLDLLLEMPTPRPHVLLISGDESIQQAVAQMSLRTVQFLRKPIDLDQLTALLTRVRKEVPPRDKSRGVGRIVGSSEQMQEVQRLILKVAPTDFAVYIEGESGTGKELVAEAIHLNSPRRAKNFVALNCGALPDSLIDSELFGHERGAFTGAATSKAGVFEQADGGTLFLDEIAEMPPELQVRLLRVLETGRVKRVGGNKEIEVDVRILAATNRAAHDAIQAGKLREDLFHRLSVFPIQLAPLRERPDDIEQLADHFLTEVIEAEGFQRHFDPACMAVMRAYGWPGNVRQLRNAVHRAYVVAEGETITPECLPPQVLQHQPATGRGDVNLPVGTTIADAERRLIEATLRSRHGDKRAAAKVLGISLRTLYYRLNEYAAADADAGGTPRPPLLDEAESEGSN